MSAGLEAEQFPIHRACRDGDVGALVSLFQQLQDLSPLSAEDSSYGWTPIHWAAHYGQLECVARLVQMGCEVNSPTSRFNQTPTHTAAFGGHAHCVLWLTQAGADVNRQDFLGEAPIHKAARSGSLECIQVLLLAGAKAHLRNASGQTAADLAQAQGSPDCVQLLSKAQRHLLQLAHGTNGYHGNGATGPLRRKRPLAALDAGHMKKARGGNDNVVVQMHSGGGEELESMSMEAAQELHSGADDYTKGFPGCPPYPAAQAEPVSAPAPSQARGSDMCGSLHLAGSPSSCVSQRASCWGGDLHYGHYHGFGDTAEDLSDHGLTVQAELRYKQAVAGSLHLYHGS